MESKSIKKIQVYKGPLILPVINHLRASYETRKNLSGLQFIQTSPKTL